ncbi:MAG: leucine-rich repeat protein [Oscillospiraceae bacterium]|nr:leucine-rich repeat protein [Oscillospiraceae bacterium]
MCVSLFPAAALAEGEGTIAPVEEPAADHAGADAPAGQEPDPAAEGTIGALPPEGDETQAAVASGDCGDDLTWTLYENGVFSVSGTGDMWEWQDELQTPWNSLRSQIREVIVAPGVTSVGPFAFCFCDALEKADLPEGLTRICAEAFGYDSTLKTIDLPEGLTEIGHAAFINAVALPSLAFPSTLETIAGYAFCGCSGLKELQFPAGLRTIGSYAFYYCTGLTKATVPDGIESIGDLAFSTCIALEELRFLGAAPSFGNEVFSSYESVPVTATIYYPDNEPSWTWDLILAVTGYYQIHWVAYTPEIPGIPIDEAHFPDPIFRAYVAEHLDLDGDGKLSEAECAAATVIDLAGSGVASLEGIQLFPELTELNAGGDFETAGALAELDLSANTKIRVLDLGFNQELGEVDVSMLTELESLMVGFCGLSELDLSGNPALKELWCDDNELTELDLSANPLLEHLDCCGNEGLTELDLRPCPTLVEYYKAGGRHISWMQESMPELYESIWVYGGTGDDDYELAVNSWTKIVAEDPHTPGDINGDGKVTVADVTLLAKYVKARGQGVEIVAGSGNVDGSADGKITVSDVTLLAKYVKARGQGVVIY